MTARILAGALCVCVVAPAMTRAAEEVDFDLGRNAALRYYRAIPLLDDLVLDDFSDTAWELIHERGTKKADARADEIIAGGEYLLKLLHEGARIEPCDWGLDEIDFETLLPHVAEARALGRLGCFRAHYRFAADDHAGGIDDAVAVIALGRHVGQDATLIARMVDGALQRMAIDLVATHLPEFDRKQLLVLEAALKRLALRPRLPRSHYVEIERQALIDQNIEKIKTDGRKRLFRFFDAQYSDEPFLKDMLRMNDKELIASFQGAAPYFAEAARLVNLPFRKMQVGFDKLHRSVRASENALAKEMFPDLKIVFSRMTEADAEFTMLQAAVAYRLEGKEALERFVDPIGQGRLTFRETADGFELLTKPMMRDVPRSSIRPVSALPLAEAPVILRVGPQAKE